MEKKTRLTISFFFAILLFFPVFSSAADFLSMENYITLQINPQNPGVRQNVNASLESYSTDLTRATITWKKDGAVIASGVGKQNTTFKTDALGKATSLVVTIKTAEGAEVEKTLTIRPGEVDLVFQADSYTPPFYKGKALFPAQGKVTIAAIPNLVDQAGNKIAADRLVYRWKKDYKPDAANSGYGKDTYVYTGSIIVKPVLISVEVSSLNNEESAESSIYLDPINPFILFYENNPLFGIRHERELGREASLRSNETTITAIPYFYSKGILKNGLLNLSWMMNGEEIFSNQNQREITLRQDGALGGIAEITLEARNPQEILQFSTSNLKMRFKPQNTSFAQ